MSTRKRTQPQLDRDRARIAELLLQQYTHQEIRDILAEETGIQLSRPQISYDIRIIREDWLTNRRDNYEALLMQELARLDALEQELWAAMRKAGQDHERETVEEYDNGSKVTKMRENVTISPSYFAQIHSIQQERRRLLGMYNSEKNSVEKTITIKAYTEISPGDWPDVVEGTYQERN